MSQECKGFSAMARSPRRVCRCSQLGSMELNCLSLAQLERCLRGCGGGRELKLVHYCKGKQLCCQHFLECFLQFEQEVCGMNFNFMR